MGRAVFGLLLGFVIVFGVAYWARTCLPEPGDKGIEWLHREDVIVVQMKQSGGKRTLEGYTTELLPEFTLYGDGTLLATQNQTRLARAHLSPGDIRGLLEFIDNIGFFDFAYEQKRPGVYDAPTTFIFAAIKEKQNAVAAYALSEASVYIALDDGSDWNEVRRLQEIHDRLDQAREQALADAEPYMPDAGWLDIEPIISSIPVDLPPWPHPDVDISSAAPDQQSGKLALSKREVDALQLEDPATARCWCLVESNGRYFAVYYRPLLLYEDNFPEFEPPTE